MDDGDGIKFNYSEWMLRIDDERPIRLISIPGTHDSCAYHGTLSWYSKPISRCVITQEKNISEQLQMGIRYLDIRCRHVNNSFNIHHGNFNLNTTFQSVLRNVIDFLKQFPTETILMRIKEEHKPVGNSRSFPDTMNSYFNENDFKEYFWRDSYSYDGYDIFRNDHDPKLAECRGKIVILQNFNGYQFGLGYKSFFDIQDDYTVTSYELKRASIKKCISIAKDFEVFKKGLINHLSGVGSLGFNPTPLGVAKKTNTFMRTCLQNEKEMVEYVGIVPADFPDQKLIHLIISTNFGNK
jgi:1-phosphatidylinositol phosphodiesterase